MTLADDVWLHIQMLWGSIGWATGAAFGVALADPNRRTILITGEGSHQLTANEIGNMGRYNANPIILCLNNDGYMVERAPEPNPDWSCNDLAKWHYAEVPHASRMHRLVHRPCRNAGRTRCSSESSPRKQIW